MKTQRRKMGREEKRRKMMDRWKVVERRVDSPAPNAWEQRGSMPSEKPERTEYPVMFAKAMEREPAASGRSPREPRKSMEIMERE